MSFAKVINEPRDTLSLTVLFLNQDERLQSRGRAREPRSRLVERRLRERTGG
jgi:hypothetical protein